MATNKCGVCGIVGHNVRMCMDPIAGVSLADLMSDSSIESAIARCNSMSAKHVQFALCHGFNVAVSGGRAKLIECINRKFMAYPSPAVPVNQAPPVQITPAPANPVNQAPASNARIAMLRAKMRTTFTKKASLTNLLADYSSQQHLVVFIEGHEFYRAEIDTYFRYIVSKREITRMANDIITRITDEVMQFRNRNYAVSMLEVNEYITALVLNTEWMSNQINSSAAQLFVQITSNTKNYIGRIIEMQDCDRQIKHLIGTFRREGISYRLPASAQAQGQNRIRQPVERIMKELSTVITCRPSVPKKQNAPPETCGICFDEFKPTLIVKTGCGHDFCSDCISGWAKQRGIKSFIQCPCCRAEIDSLTVGNKAAQKRVKSGLAPFE